MGAGTIDPFRERPFRARHWRPLVDARAARTCAPRGWKKSRPRFWVRDGTVERARVPCLKACRERRSSMVTAVAKPVFAPTNGRKACPRCKAYLVLGYHEPECLRCGYVDYEYQAPAPINNSILGSGTRYILRYVGEFPTLAETLTYVQLRRVRNRAVFGVSCPFCVRPMEQTSLSGKRREVREQRYECSLGHRVSLTPTRKGSMGWK